MILLSVIVDVAFPVQPAATTKKLKRWHPNTTILPEMWDYYYYSRQKEQNASLISNIVRGQIVRMYGPRASGKSSRAWDAIMQLYELGYECI